MRTIFLSILAMLLMCGVASAAPPGLATGGGGISKNVQAIPAAAILAGTSIVNFCQMASLQTQAGAIEPKGLIEVAAIGANPIVRQATNFQVVIANAVPGSDPGISRLSSEVALSGDCKALAGGTRANNMENSFATQVQTGVLVNEVPLRRIWPISANSTIMFQGNGAFMATANCANA